MANEIKVTCPCCRGDIKHLEDNTVWGCVECECELPEEVVDRLYGLEHAQRILVKNQKKKYERIKALETDRDDYKELLDKASSCTFEQAAKIRELERQLKETVDKVCKPEIQQYIGIVNEISNLICRAQSGEKLTSGISFRAVDKRTGKEVARERVCWLYASPIEQGPEARLAEVAEERNTLRAQVEELKFNGDRKWFYYCKSCKKTCDYHNLIVGEGSYEYPDEVDVSCPYCNSEDVHQFEAGQICQEKYDAKLEDDENFEELKQLRAQVSGAVTGVLDEVDFSEDRAAYLIPESELLKLRTLAEPPTESEGRGHEKCSHCYAKGIPCEHIKPAPRPAEGGE